MSMGGNCLVRIIEHPCNIGLGATRNTSIESAAGEYLMFLDSDDWLEVECVSLLYAERMRSGVDVVCGRSMTDSGEVSPVVGGCVERERVGLLLSYFNGCFPVTIWNKLYDVGMLRHRVIRCIPHQSIEDNWFTFQLLLSIGSYGVIPEITHHRSIRSGSITNGGDWGIEVYDQWPAIMESQLRLLVHIDPVPLRILMRKKLFWSRVHISECALVGGYGSYVKSYLRPTYLRDRDTLSSPFLLCAYIFCCTPLFIKRIGLILHFKLSKK
jgi:glycosyltransferase involved in cell wall biosynthesis